jgi:methoxymalonate biosynthesis protein
MSSEPSEDQVATRLPSMQRQAGEAAGTFFRIDSPAARGTCEVFFQQLLEGLGSATTKERASLEWKRVAAALAEMAQADQPWFPRTMTLKSFLTEMAVGGGQGHSGTASAVGGAVRMMALGHASPALRANATAHSLACHALREFGSGSEIVHTLRRLEQGELQGCFALTESGSGSSISSMRSHASIGPNGTLSLTADKRWITGGQTADVGLVLATSPLGPLALLLDARGDSVHREAEPSIAALSGYSLSRWTVRDCPVSRAFVVGEPGIATTHIAPDSLALGRLLVAAGAVGVVLGCVSVAFTHALTRRTDDGHLLDLPLIRRLVSRLHCSLETSFLLCMKAAVLAEERSPDFHLYAMEAKYHCAEAAKQACEAAIQVCGAAAFAAGNPLMAYAVEAAVCGVIEGPTTVCEQSIPSYLEMFA